MYMVHVTLNQCVSTTSRNIFDFIAKNAEFLYAMTAFLGMENIEDVLRQNFVTMEIEQDAC